MVPRAQRPVFEVLKMRRSLVLQPGLSVGLLVGRTSRGVLGHPIHACLRPASEGMQAEGSGICSGIAEGEVSICATTRKRSGVPPSLSAGCLSDHWNGVISAAMLVCQDVSVVGCLWDNVLFE